MTTTAEPRANLPLDDVSVQASSGLQGADSTCTPQVLDGQLSQVEAAAAASFLKAVADPLRLRMLSYLTQSAKHEACVCDLAELADVSQPTVSHHLKVLRDAGILRAERRGTWVWYAVEPAHAPSVATLLNSFAAHLS
jgi:ArsR family transcriptional regulator